METLYWKNRNNFLRHFPCLVGTIIIRVATCQHPFFLQKKITHNDMCHIFIEQRLGAWLHDSGTSGISSSPLLLHGVPLQRRAGHQIQTELCITEFPNRSLLGNSTEIINQLWNSTYTHTPILCIYAICRRCYWVKRIWSFPRSFTPFSTAALTGIGWEVAWFLILCFVSYFFDDWDRSGSCLVFSFISHMRYLIFD